MPAGRISDEGKVEGSPTLGRSARELVTGTALVPASAPEDSAHKLTEDLESGTTIDLDAVVVLVVDPPSENRSFALIFVVVDVDEVGVPPKALIVIGAV